MSEAKPARRAPRIAVITLSDRAARRQRLDLSGPLVAADAERILGARVISQTVLADDRTILAMELIRLADGEHCDLILTTGGTGLSPRDLTPEATRDVIDREVPGIPEVLRSAGREWTTRAVLSRGVAGLRGSTLIINLSGSPRAASEQMDVLAGILPHALESVSGVVLDCAR